MSRYGPDTLVAVFPFTRQPEGDEIVIGRPETAVFVALPADGVELLDLLAAGKTVSEAQGHYQAQYGEVPDLDDFLTLLEHKGFVRPVQAAGAAESAAAAELSAPAPVRFHLQQFPESLARRLFGRTALVIYGALILLGLVLIAADPSLLPNRTALYFPEQMTLLRISLMLLGIVMVLIHELAHLVAARAVGVASRIGLGNRLWMLVAETDMTGVWALPRRQRYLPMLAGPLIDAVSTALLLLVSFATRRGWIDLPLPLLRLLQALLLSYLLQLLWQCYFFVQTDLYYVLANLFQCKNLMADTEAYLRSQLHRLLGKGERQDLSYIPPAEMVTIRRYAVVWLLGRAVAVVVLLGIYLPGLTLYLMRLGAIFGSGYRADPYAYLDALLVSSIFLLQQGAGLVLWVRGLFTKGR